MPFYEYECENCKFYTELLQKVSDAPLRKCPSCGKNAMKKLVSAPVFRLKGAGWYETDFKGDKENKRNLAVDKEPETASTDDKAKAAASSSDAKADTKPAETKAAEPVSSGKASSSGGARRSTSPSRTAAAAKSRAKAPARTAAKAKAKPAARRKSR